MKNFATLTLEKVTTTYRDSPAFITGILSIRCVVLDHFTAITQRESAYHNWQSIRGMSMSRKESVATVYSMLLGKGH